MTGTSNSISEVASKSPVLAIHKLNIVLREDGTRLVDNLSIEVNRGEVFALVGESGSGKSITALSILRLLPSALEIEDGYITLARNDLLALTEAEMNKVRGKRIAMIFQEPQSSLNPVKTIGSQLCEVFQLHQQLTRSQRWEQAIQGLAEVGIPDPEQRMHWYPHQLSGGQKQRVMIAMALASEPELLIADEPTTALDVTIQKQVLDLIKQLQKKRDLSVLLITHDMGVVANMADHVAVMRKGIILEQASAKQFFHRPQHEYSQQLINALPETSQFLSMEKSATPLLQVTNLNVWFPIKKGVLQRTVDYTKAVKNVSFEINAGETLALVGESGSGKSTTGRAILRLDPISSGHICFSGQSIQNLDRKSFLPFRRKIQVIFQDPYSSMNPRMRIKDILEEGIQSLRPEVGSLQRRKIAEQLLLRVGLEKSHLLRYPHEFSGGQRQRIAIARALAVEPELIICDEPSSALDVSIRGQVLELLKTLQEQEGLSYLFITHDLSLIPNLAHSVAVMKEGEIVEYGSSQEILQSPKHEYTRALLAAIPVIE